MGLVEQYSDLKTRIDTLRGKRQQWEGRKEAHEAVRKGIEEELKGLGIDHTDLTKAKASLEQQVQQRLTKLEGEVTAAEGQFNKLRSNHE